MAPAYPEAYHLYVAGIHAMVLTLIAAAITSCASPLRLPHDPHTASFE